jgi:hypothetical protein
MNRIHFTTARAIESLPDTRFAANDGAFGRQLNSKSARKGKYCNRSTGSAIWWHKTRVTGPPNHKNSEQTVGKQYYILTSTWFTIIMSGKFVAKRLFSVPRRKKRLNYGGSFVRMYCDVSIVKYKLFLLGTNTKNSALTRCQIAFWTTLEF